jgi:acyl-CoA synthetase (NDP forming)
VPDLEFLFNPRSVAVVGASSNPDSLANRNFIRPLLALGYQGRIYPINPHQSEIMGLKAYASILDIPEEVDNVVCAIPAPLTPRLMEDCVKAKAKAVTCYSAGFSETGEEEGLKLEKTIAEIARRGGVRVIGPNCLGVHHPEVGLTFEPNSSRSSGPVSFLSQSGGNARELILIATGRGIRFSKGISYGNASDLNEADFVEYFADDKDTRVIAAYIEGIKEPPRFLRALARVTQEKPVIILKGGKSGAGTRAVASHTGALAGSRGIWDALCQQAGVTQVGSLEELAGDILAFSYLKPPRGRRVGIVGVGGGASVQAADDCEATGLTVPPFPPAVVQAIREFTPQAGVGLGNPIDTSADVYWDPVLFAKTIRLVAGFDGVDILFIVLGLIYAAKHKVGMVDEQVKALIEAGRETDKPVVVVLRTGGLVEAEQLAGVLRVPCLEAGFPVYTSVRQAARAMDHLILCHEDRERKARQQLGESVS